MYCRGQLIPYIYICVRRVIMHPPSVPQMSILERLQSEVEGDNVTHQKSIQEKDEMIERVSAATNQH